MIRLFTLILVLIVASACSLTRYEPNTQIITQIPPAQQAESTDEVLPPDVIPPSTPLPTLTPTRTLLPPPTFEPPTLTPFPTNTPSPTVPPTLDTRSHIEGLHGLETETPVPTVECSPRDDWHGTYTVQPGDYLFNLAQRFGTTVDAIASANCLRQVTIISVGTVLKVPGAPPGSSGIECVAWEVLTPQDNTFAVGGTGQLTFNWRGPRAPRNLIRVYRPDGSTYERVIELRQNETIDLADLPAGGQYRWYVYPLDQNFRQIECMEGGPWYFNKEPAPPPTNPPALPGM